MTPLNVAFDKSACILTYRIMQCKHKYELSLLVSRVYCDDDEDSCAVEVVMTKVIYLFQIMVEGERIAAVCINTTKGKV
jgi:hypothetical protein